MNYSSFLSNDSFAIFLFHGVVRQHRHAIRNYTHKHIDVDRFASLMRDLRSHGTPVSMPEIVVARREKRPLPPRAFAITFDDGFENNYSVAAPVLSDMGIPSTFYVTASFIESNGCSWIDMIENAVESVPAFHLQLPYTGLTGFYFHREEKIQLLDRIRQVVKNNPSIEPYQFAEDLWRQLGIRSLDPDEELDKKMSWAQLSELHCHPLFTVGGHGYTHRILTFLSPEDLENEIVHCLSIIRQNLAAPIEQFSYPEGLTHCYSPLVIECLRHHGIVCAPTAEHGTNSPEEDLFHLKRIMVV